MGGSVNYLCLYYFGFSKIDFRGFQEEKQTAHRRMRRLNEIAGQISIAFSLGMDSGPQKILKPGCFQDDIQPENVYLLHKLFSHSHISWQGNGIICRIGGHRVGSVAYNDHLSARVDVNVLAMNAPSHDGAMFIV